MFFFSLVLSLENCNLNSYIIYSGVKNKTKYPCNYPTDPFTQNVSDRFYVQSDTNIFLGSVLPRDVNFYSKKFNFLLLLSDLHNNLSYFLVGCPTILIQKKVLETTIICLL